MLSLDELQNLARAHQREQTTIAIMQRNMPKPRRPRAIPAVPMAPLAKETLRKTLASIDANAVKLFVILSDLEADPQGVVHVERKELAEHMGCGLTTVAVSAAILRSSGLLQRIGRKGYRLRAR